MNQAVIWWSEKPLNEQYYFIIMLSYNISLQPLADVMSLSQICHVFNGNSPFKTIKRQPLHIVIAMRN